MINLKTLILLFFIVILWFGCSNPIGSDSDTVSISDTTKKEEEKSKIYGCTIDSIVVTSLNASGWDTGFWGTEGDPFFKLYFNDSLIKTTSTFKDVTSSSLPLSYTINKDLGFVKLSDTISFKLMDEDISEHDTKIKFSTTNIAYYNSQTISFKTTDYNFNAMVYLTWNLMWL